MFELCKIWLDCTLHYEINARLRIQIGCLSYSGVFEFKLMRGGLAIQTLL